MNIYKRQRSNKIDIQYNKSALVTEASQLVPGLILFRPSISLDDYKIILVSSLSFILVLTPRYNEEGLFEIKISYVTDITGMISANNLYVTVPNEEKCKEIDKILSHTDNVGLHIPPGFTYEYIIDTTNDFVIDLENSLR